MGDKRDGRLSILGELPLSPTNLVVGTAAAWHISLFPWPRGLKRFCEFLQAHQGSRSERTELIWREKSRTSWRKGVSGKGLNPCLGLFLEFGRPLPWLKFVFLPQLSRAEFLSPENIIIWIDTKTLRKYPKTCTELGPK